MYPSATLEPDFTPRSNCGDVNISCAVVDGGGLEACYDASLFISCSVEAQACVVTTREALAPAQAPIELAMSSGQPVPAGMAENLQRNMITQAWDPTYDPSWDPLANVEQLSNPTPNQELEALVASGNEQELPKY